LLLTDTKLRNLRPTGKRYELPDRDGLVLRVSQGGVMTWTVSVRVRGTGEQSGQRIAKLAGTKQRIGLGEYPGISLALARERASAMRRMARDGKGPRGSKHTLAAETVGSSSKNSLATCRAAKCARRVPLERSRR
jgi:hypothetical protein